MFKKCWLFNATGFLFNGDGTVFECIVPKELYTRYAGFCITSLLELIIVMELVFVLKGGVKMDLSPIGSRIKAAREKKQITQEELAGLLDMSTTHISVIERGVKPPRLETLIRIANALDVSSDYLLMDILDNPADVVAGELAEIISKLSPKEKEKALTIIRVLSEE